MESRPAPAAVFNQTRIFRQTISPSISFIEIRKQTSFFRIGPATALSAKDIDFGFQAFTQAKIVHPDSEPTARFLIEIEPTANLNNPTIVEPDLAVMQLRVEFYF